MGALADERHIYRPVISHSSSLRVSADFVLISFFLFFFLLTGFSVAAAALQGGTELALNSPRHL